MLHLSQNRIQVKKWESSWIDGQIFPGDYTRLYAHQWYQILAWMRSLWLVVNFKPCISLNLYTGKVTALTLLDLSAAVDTIDYSLLLDHPSDWYGISGTAHTWICSFLTNRSQSIKIRNGFLKEVPMFCSIHHGSVHGPLLFTLYTTLLSSLTHSHKLDHHLYADDTQVNIHIFIYSRHWSFP